MIMVQVEVQVSQLTFYFCIGLGGIQCYSTATSLLLVYPVP